MGKGGAQKGTSGRKKKKERGTIAKTDIEKDGENIGELTLKFERKYNLKKWSPIWCLWVPWNPVVFFLVPAKGF